MTPTTTPAEAPAQPISYPRLLGAMGTIIGVSILLSWLPLIGTAVAGYTGGRVARTREVGLQAALFVLAITVLLTAALWPDVVRSLPRGDGVRVAAAIGGIIGFLILAGILVHTTLWGARSAQRRLNGIKQLELRGTIESTEA
ncbi:MAG: hypothetical protein ACT4OZ_04795 [Gemmatimonadota bacterium]